jgi:hypothetical protein
LAKIRASAIAVSDANVEAVRELNAYKLALKRRKGVFGPSKGGKPGEMKSSVQVADGPKIHCSPWMQELGSAESWSS